MMEAKAHSESAFCDEAVGARTSAAKAGLGELEGNHLETSSIDVPFIYLLI